MGGTFDPPHLGHLELARAARRELGLDGVLYIPAGCPSFKRDREVTSAHHRLAMLSCMLEGEPACALSAMEVERLTRLKSCAAPGRLRRALCSFLGLTRCIRCRIGTVPGVCLGLPRLRSQAGRGRSSNAMLRLCAPSNLMHGCMCWMPMCRPFPPRSCAPCLREALMSPACLIRAFWITYALMGSIVFAEF